MNKNLMKRIALDMDGVLADVTEQFCRYNKRDFGIRKTPEEIAGVPELEAFPNSIRHVFEPGFFRTTPLIPGCREVVENLNRHYELFIVSAATEFPQSLTEKLEWLSEHFPFLGWKQFVFCGLKTIIRADIMIDDHFKNLDHFPGTTYLFTQPHNQFQDSGRHQRVQSWKELDSLLL